MFKTFPIVLDVTKHQLNDMFQVNSNDLNTVRLNLSIKSGLDIFDLTGKIVRIAIKKPDGFIAFQTGGVTDPSNGLCEFILDRQAYLVEGKHEAEVMIYQDDSTVIVTERFYYKVNRAIVNDKTLISTNHLPAISQAIIAGEQLKDIDIPEFVEAANSAYETIEEAETQGLYAKGQGDYAKQEADRAAARVTELNGVDAVQFKGKQDQFEVQLNEVLTNNETYIKGNVFDYTSLNDAKTRAINSKSKILNLGSDRTFNIGANTINLSGLIVKGNNVIIQGGGVTVATVSGSIGTFTPITADVVRGGKSIDSTLAASLQPGDLVKIKSSAYFSAAETDRMQGEMHVVQSVTGNTITFTDTLFDSYTVANSTVIAKVTPTSFSISKGIKIRNTGSGTNDIGLSITYAYKPITNCSFEKCGYASLLINDCYEPISDIIVNDSSYAETTTSYGIAINNATMYANTKGTINFCRHCVAHGGNSAGGVAWESKVEVNGSGNPDMPGNSVFDAHGSTGSVYWINCIANNSHQGIKANARYNYIKNCSGRTPVAGAEFVVVSSGTGGSVDILEVDGLTLDGYDWGVETNRLVKNLICKNINSKWGVSIRGDVDKWDFSDINVSEMGVHVYASAVNVPDTLRVTNIKGKYPNLAIANTSAYLLYNDSPSH